MMETITARLDEKAIRALHRLEATGMSRSEAIGSALILATRGIPEAPASGGSVPGDEADREEMRQMADLIDRMRAAR